MKSVSNKDYNIEYKQKQYKHGSLTLVKFKNTP